MVVFIMMRIDEFFWNLFAVTQLGLGNMLVASTVLDEIVSVVQCTLASSAFHKEFAGQKDWLMR